MWKKIMFILLLVFMSTGCTSEEKVDDTMESYPKSPAIQTNQVRYANFDGNEILQTDVAVVNYTNRNQGYICVRAKHDGTAKIKIQISKDDVKYNYDLQKNENTAFPLQLGSGTYLVKVLKNVEGNTYAVLDSISFKANITSETAPFEYPNQIVWYSKNDKVIRFALDTVKQDDNDLKRIRDIYTKVAETIIYDEDKAQKASQKYIIPHLEELLKSKKGICFDYASLMVAMLRINHIPARLICGNTDVEYHAWVEVYVDGKGWVNPDIFVDEDTWTRMDPTFASQKFQYDGRYDAIYYY